VTKVAQAKLTEADVLRVREIYAKGYRSLGEIARQFGVSKSTVAGICNRRTWKHVG
jgi:DNA-binding MarR family transcriptional regulator